MANNRNTIQVPLTYGAALSSIPPSFAMATAWSNQRSSNLDDLSAQWRAMERMMQTGVMQTEAPSPVVKSLTPVPLSDLLDMQQQGDPEVEIRKFVK